MALIALLVAAGGWAVWQGELRRDADAELIERAGAQRTVAQRVALLIALDTPSGRLQAEAALADAHRGALRIETLLRAGHEDGMAQLPPGLATSVRQWQDSRERLWYRAQALLSAVASEGGELAEGAGSPTAAQAAERRAQALPGLLDAADQSLLGAQALVKQVEQHARDKAEAALHRLAVFGGLAAMLMLGLSLGVVEPAARRLAAQRIRLAEQAAALQRLALVAERTHNVVVVTDAERRIVWVNDAFTRVTGYSAAEAQGRSPGALLQSEATDPAAVARMRQAFAAGRGVRVEIVNRAKSGRTYWLDIDIQPLHDEAGTLTGFVAVETDISEQVQQRQRLRTLLDALPTGVIEADAGGALVDANTAAEQMLGLTRDQLCGRTSVDERWRTVHEDLSPYPGDQHPLSRSLRDGASVRGDSMGVVAPDGRQRWILVNSEPLRDPAGGILGAVACFVDVTEHRAQRTLLQLALQASAIGTWEWRPETGERHWSPTSCAMLGYSPTEFAPLLPAWRDRIHPDDTGTAQQQLLAHLANPAVPYHSEVRVRHRDGHWIWLQIHGSVVERDVTGRAQRLVGVHIDISGRKQAELKLLASATHDSLTGLPNRAALMPALQAAAAAHEADVRCHFALLFLDFDRFKQVNDTLGHAAGDELLRQIAARLQGALRTAPLQSPNGPDPDDPDDRDRPEGRAHVADDAQAGACGPRRTVDTVLHGSPGCATAARLGGDEFVVLLRGLSRPDDAAAVAERLLQVLAAPYEVRGQRLHSSASIGVVTSRHATGDAEALLRDADTAMYEAKRAGRGRWVLFQPKMQAVATQRAALKADLHEALLRDELFVVYQPVLHLDATAAAGGAPAPGCAGVEALVRWRHPERGLVSPGQFIDVAEETGLIGAIGGFVLDTACRQFVRWRAELGERAPQSLAVNLSVAQLRHADLVPQVGRLLDECDMPPEALQLEVTETLAAQDAATQQRLSELKSLGVRLALDDFGTGYSSLSCLHRLPVDTVKIDRSFVIEAERSEYHRALIEATVRVARTLRMTTVAEGIETPAQSALVTQLGCERGQGYLYCHPLPADDLTAWLAARPASGPRRPPHGARSPRVAELRVVGET